MGQVGVKVAGPCLVVGASGFVGRRLLAALRPAGALGTYHRHPLDGAVPFDAAAERLADRFLTGGRRWSHAFLLHAVSGIDTCARDPAGTGRINVDATCRMIDDLQDAGVAPIFTSSDAVLDGTGHLVDESVAVAPVLTYGRHKAAVEAHLAARSGDWAVARLAKVTGTDPGASALFGEWMAAIDAGAPIRCAHDQVFSPIGLDDAVAGLAGIAARSLHGLYHLGGPSAWSRLGLLRRFLADLRRHRRVEVEVIPCSLHDLPLAERRPLDTSMRSDKLMNALGTRFADPAELSAAAARALADRARAG